MQLPLMRKKTAFFPTLTSLLKPVSLQNKGSTLSPLIAGPESHLCEEGERRCCSAQALLWEPCQPGQDSSQQALGTLLHVKEITQICTQLEFASEGCESHCWLNRCIQIYYRPALMSFLSLYKGRKFPVHLILYFALEHKRGQGLMYKVYLTDS